MVAFVEHQQQVFRLWQHRFALHGRHHQRMVGHHHFRFLDFAPGDEEWAFAVVVAVAVKTAGFIGAQPPPQGVINGLVGMIAQSIPFIAVEIGFQRRAELLFGLVFWRQIVIEERQQILLRRLGTGQRRQITRTNVAATAKGGGKAQVGNNLAQQRQVFTVDLILQRDVGGTDHQRFLFLTGNGDAGDQI